MLPGPMNFDFSCSIQVVGSDFGLRSVYPISFHVSELFTVRQCFSLPPDLSVINQIITNQFRTIQFRFDKSKCF